MHTCYADTLQKVLVESRDHGAFGGPVALDELRRAEDTAAGLALAGDVGASGNRNRVHCDSHGEVVVVSLVWAIEAWGSKRVGWWKDNERNEGMG